MCCHPGTVATFIAAAAKSFQSCPTLCDPIDGSPPGSSVPGILQARTMEWVAIPFSNAWKWKVQVKLLSCVWLLAPPWTAAHQTPPSMGFSRQEYWSGLPLPSPLEKLVWTKCIFSNFLSIQHNQFLLISLTLNTQLSPIHQLFNNSIFTYKELLPQSKCILNVCIGSYWSVLFQFLTATEMQMIRL